MSHSEVVERINSNHVAKTVDIQQCNATAWNCLAKNVEPGSEL